MRPHPLKWHGGKYYLARWIVSQMPPHLHYVEPYFGGGAVLFARDPNRNWSERPEQKGCSEVVNDINGDLMNFYQIVKNDIAFSEFQKQIALLPFSEFVFDQARVTLADPDSKPLDRAIAFFHVMRMSRQGLGKDFATVTRNRTRGRMNEQVNAYLSTVDGLPAVHDRLQRVVILSRPALAVIWQQDGPQTLFYLDPPYLHETRTVTDAYEFEMTEKDHRELLETVSGIRGKFLLSGYPSRLYQDYAKDQQWRCMTRAQRKHSQGAHEKSVATECLWANY